MSFTSTNQKSASQIIHERFREFDKAVVEKGKLIWETEGGPYNVHYWPSTTDPSFVGEEKREFQLFRFGCGITILRGIHKLEGSESHRVSGFPECAYVHSDLNYEWKEYTLFKNGDALKVICDEKEIKETVKKITGIDLPKIDTRIDEDDDPRYPQEMIRKEVRSDAEKPEYYSNGHYWEDPAVVVQTYQHYLKNFPEEIKKIASDKKLKKSLLRS